MIVEEAITRRSFKKVAILADSTNYGQLGREDLEKALAAKGIKPVAVEKFNIKDVDMTRPAAQGQGSRRRGDPDLRHRPGTGADRQRHGQAGLEGADDRQLDAVHGQLHRQRRPRTATARACRRPSSRSRPRPSARPSSISLPEDLQAEGRPHRLRRCRRRRATTRSTCWPPPSSRPAPPTARRSRAALEDLKDDGRRRGHHLQPTLHAKTTTRPSPPTCRCWAKSRAVTWSMPTRRPEKGTGRVKK